MNALTLDEIVPLEEYLPRRAEYFEAHNQYLDRYRRVQIGPKLTLIFENRQTIWYRIQEIVRIARLRDPKALQQELNDHNHLLPRPGTLQAALLIAIENEAKLSEELKPWQNLRGDDLSLHIGDSSYPANLFTSRPEDRCFGAAHWVQFFLDEYAMNGVNDRHQPMLLRIDLPSYQHESPLLSDEVRFSLIEDLEIPSKTG